jgi:acyl dehydratase
MTTTTETERRALTAGMTFPDMPCTITRAQQAKKLACCGLDPALHGDRIDITQLAYTAILALRHAGFTINGMVHMTQAFDLRAPLLLGEPLICRGSVISVAPERRGQIEESRFDFVRPDGSIPLSTRRSSLRLDPERKPGAGAERKPGATEAARVPEDPRAGLDLIARHQLVPDKVAAYSDEAENLIHSDPETARRFGFRAPIAAGLMAVHYMMAALCRPAPPDQLRMHARFRRPMFWDEELAVWGKRRTDGTIAALALINPGGKVANDCAIDDVDYNTAK